MSTLRPVVKAMKMPTVRKLLKPATKFIRSVIGTNGIAAQIAAIDAKVDGIFRTLCGANGSMVVASDPSGSLDPLPPQPHLDINLLLHHSRSSLMRDIPPGATRLLSAGCAGRWYFDWIERTYGRVQEHIGIEFYSPRPDDLPDNVTWIANTVGNMEAVADKSCDLLISGQNIEHLWPEEVADFLVESARVLKAGGTLCVDSPNRALTERLVWSHPEHTIELTVPEMRHLLDLAGFDVTKEAGIWLCQDPKTGHLFPNDPNSTTCDWTVTERLFSARDKPEQSLLWWFEARRSLRGPDRKAVGAVLDDIFSKAWPERIQRLIVAPGHAVDQRADGEWIVVPSGQGGVVFFGPYMPLRAGRHRVTFDLIPDQGTSGAYARCDVTAGPMATVLQECEIRTGSQQATLEIDLSTLTFGAQFRCVSLGRGGFAVRRHVTLIETLV
jgi:SAM-dependent methyltransferase